MLDSQVLAFVVVATMLAITPGSDTILVLKNSLRFGAGSGGATTFGILAGTLVHAVISALGVSVLVAQSEFLFLLIQGAGSLYLVWLGFQTFRSAQQLPHLESPGPKSTNRSAFLEGLLTNVLNPKVAIFYVAFLPQFIEPSDPVLAKSLLLAAIHNGLSAVWLGSLVWLTSAGKGWIQRPKVQQWFARTSGVLLMGFGLRLALESR